MRIIEVARMLRNRDLVANPLAGLGLGPDVYAIPKISNYLKPPVLPDIDLPSIPSISLPNINPSVNLNVSTTPLMYGLLGLGALYYLSKRR